MAVSGPVSADELAEQAERFLRARLPASWVNAIDEDDADALSSAREELDLDQWWLDLAEVGYVTPTWPVEYGGLGIAPKAASGIARMLGRYKVPRFTNPIGVDLAGSAILRWGTDEQKERFLRPIAQHREIWCQLFSEPSAGSDLASLATRAVRDGDTWIVNGQKVWASMAHEASFGLLLARTDPDVPKHQGITVFIVPMDNPGSPSGRCPRSPGIRSSTRSSSTTPRSTTRCASARSVRGGRSALDPGTSGRPSPAAAPRCRGTTTGRR